MFIQRAEGGLKLVRMSTIRTIEIEKLERQRFTGRLLGWRDGIYSIEVDGQLVDVGEKTAFAAS